MGEGEGASAPRYEQMFQLDIKWVFYDIKKDRLSLGQCN